MQNAEFIMQNCGAGCAGDFEIMCVNAYHHFAFSILHFTFNHVVFIKRSCKFAKKFLTSEME